MICEWYVSGLCCALIGREVRAPLCVLWKVWSDCDIPTITRRTSDGTYWHAIRCRTLAEAAGVFARLKKEYPHGYGTREMMLRCSGGRLS
jgi:hypothetical protein